MGYLDKTGLSRLWDKVKTKASKKAEYTYSNTEPTTTIWADSSIGDFATIWNDISVGGDSYLKIKNGDNWITITNSPESTFTIPLVSFSTGTDDEITAMIEGFYNNKLTLDDIKSVWSVGDTRDIYINAMDGIESTESHHADTYSFVILDFEHDDLAEEINGHTKALITIQTVDVLHSAGITYMEGDVELGKMSLSIDSTVSGWTTCTRRTWCNNVFKKALPEYIQNLNKLVNIISIKGDNTSTTTNDYVFLIDANEANALYQGLSNNPFTVYSYYKDNSDRIYKLPPWNSNDNNAKWVSRSLWAFSATYKRNYYLANAKTSFSTAIAEEQFWGGVSFAPTLCL